jgi:hypothetical protein
MKFKMIQEVVAESGQNSGIHMQRFYRLDNYTDNCYMVEVIADPSCVIQSTVQVLGMDSTKIGNWVVLFSPPILAYRDDLGQFSRYAKNVEKHMGKFCDRIMTQFMEILFP